MKEGIFEIFLAFVIFGICLGVPAMVGSWAEGERRREELTEQKNSLEEELKVLSQKVDGRRVGPLLKILDLENEINRLEAEMRR